MYKLPIIISSVLFAIAVVVCAYLLTSSKLTLTDAQLVSSLITLFTCLGALISATFVVYSYLQTNRIFLLGQRPSLLIQVTSEQLIPIPQSKNSVPFTTIHYTNTTSNEFDDLTILVKLTLGSREIDLSDLFKPKMFMAAYDQRHRQFETLSFLASHGVDINKEITSGNQVMLSLSYTFTFNSKLEERKGPEYKWNYEIQRWELA
jgi:hypothetical protein